MHLPYSDSIQLRISFVFCSELWEKKPLLVKRHMENYNDGWLSTAELDRILREVCVLNSLNPAVLNIGAGIEVYFQYEHQTLI